MSGPSSGGYAPTESFASAPVTAVATDDERVVLGTEAGEVEIVGADGRATATLEDAVADVAVGSRVYALAGDTVAAVSTAGTRVWSVEVEGATALAALPEADVLGVLTAAGEFLGFDGETGGSRFETSQPHADVTTDPEFFAAEGLFVLAAWSFLAACDPDGGVRFERNLDGAIESAGIVDGTVVVSLKNERVVGLDADAGGDRWERELAVADLPDRGDDALLFTADESLVSLSADGTYTEVDSVPGGRVHPTTDGERFCTVADGTVSVYRSRGSAAESLTVALAADELAPDARSLDLDVANAGDRPVSASLEIDCDGLRVATTEVPVDLQPGESTAVSLAVVELVPDATATVAVTVGEQRLLSADISVAAVPGGELSAAAELDRIADGAAEVSVTVTNEGDAACTGVVVSPGDDRLGTLAPGEDATATVEAAFDSGGDVRVTARADDTDAVETTVALPDAAVEVGVERADGFVDVRLDAAAVPVADDLLVRGDPFAEPVERRVTVPPEGTFVLACRPDRRTAGLATVEAALAGLDRAQTAELDGDTLAVAETTGRPARSARPANAESGRRATSRSGRHGGGRGRERVRDRAPTGGDTATGTDSDDRPPRDRRDESAGRDGRDTDAAAPAPVRREPSLTVSRRLRTTDPARTELVESQLTVENAGDAPAESVRIEAERGDGAGDAAVETLEPGDRVVFERAHAFTESGSAALPPVAVTADNAATVRTEETPLSVSSGPLAVTAAFEPADGDGDRAATVAVENDREVGCRVSRVGVEGLPVWDADRSISGGESAEWTHAVAADALPDGPAVETVVEYAFDGGEKRHWRTLGHVPEREAGSGGDGLAGLALRIGEETHVSGGYGSVVLAVENRADAPLADLSVAASGPAVSELMYVGGETVDRLDSGAAHHHFVDVETDSENVELSVTLSARVDGEEVTEELTVGGPAPQAEGEWDDDTRDRWWVERPDAGASANSGSGAGDALPDRLVTEFESR